MKAKLFYILSLAAILYACHPINVEDTNYSFFIFRFTDEANKEWIITTPLKRPVDSSLYGIGTINGILNFPKRYRNEPYYGSSRWLQNPEKYSYDICELATEEKYLSLHSGYYTYFPYTSIVEYEQCVVRDGKWDSVCACNPLGLPIIGNASMLYNEIRLFEIRSLEKITGKSRKEMTIDDIEKSINKIIDEGKLDKYSRIYHNMWRSME